MSKPKSLNKNSDNTYSHYCAPEYKMYSVNHDEVPANTTLKFKGKGWIMLHSDLDLVNALKHDEFYYATNLKSMVAQLNQISVTRVNCITGVTYEESVTTPISCSPAFETYWSM